jgi:hypothetical protein
VIATLHDGEAGMVDCPRQAEMAAVKFSVQHHVSRVPVREAPAVPHVVR